MEWLPPCLCRTLKSTTIIAMTCWTIRSLRVIGKFLIRKNKFFKLEFRLNMNKNVRIDNNGNAFLERITEVEVQSSDEVLLQYMEGEGFILIL